jgi:acetyl/propionyl-CoA carboxylase alpha subunit
MVQKNKISRVFIANRGEIARRISQTCKKMGIETVALTDRKIPPSYLAEVVTKFLHVEEESTSLYINPQAMIDFAKAGQCDAVHPGFGFLSENAQFAEAVINAGLQWIGPRPGAIDAMASKAAARVHAEKSGVPCLPGINGLNLEQGEQKAFLEVENFTRKNGFPILIKASFGGGGKGMRIVHKSEDLLDNIKIAAQEATSSFGNGSLIVEKYLPAPRHVEIQILSDRHGNITSLGDRDCSLQRRHQKILEEAPAPGIPQNVRDSMHTAARKLSETVGYDSAGTVEFLLDDSNKEQVKFYFLEMNTRLQVEHTVTEEVFGVDLVEWQIRIAQNDQLPPEFLTLKPRGHSIEVRIYAEDPGSNFFPVPGPVRAFLPAQGKGVRWELGMDTVDNISTQFDPMISKLICTAGNRADAFNLLIQTLERTTFCGPRNNIPFLIWLAKDPTVLNGSMNTHFIGANVTTALDWERQERAKLDSVALELMSLVEHSGLISGGLSLKNSHVDHQSISESAFAKGTSAAHRQKVPSRVQIISDSIAWNPSSSETPSRYGLGFIKSSQGGDKLFSFAKFEDHSTSEFWVGLNGHNWLKSIQRGSSLRSSGSAVKGEGMRAPVPGKVIAIHVKASDQIVSGQTLFTLESMKMQFEVKAGKSGDVKQILVALGDQVQANQELGTWNS